MNKRMYGQDVLANLFLEQNPDLSCHQVERLMLLGNIQALAAVVLGRPQLLPYRP